MRMLAVLLLLGIGVAVLLYVRSDRGGSSPSGAGGSAADAAGGANGGGSEAAVASAMRDYTVADFEEMLAADAEVQLVDVRTQKEWDEGHLDGAIFIPVADLASRLAELDSSKPVVTYCAAGGRSAKAMKILDKNGFEVRGHLKPGIRGWIAEGKPVVE